MSRLVRRKVGGEVGAKHGAGPPASRVSGKGFPVEEPDGAKALRWQGEKWCGDMVAGAENEGDGSER